ncbi:gamma-glutamylcyclotransferase family protein [Breoghania sp. L-A4]|uniref:gamma-glutamylcyclotransferase family protein n=1 Tax=Breoghania sp. L-A4 TaxID=2304600 RepID=UPI000E35E49C|nr:gamma-glutamylcyclotransferase family protein [Breoghania sp. L-A4]AXS40310.1 gamma-glutamylcyclotransferase [Breoghania sp. L-A4]
MTDTISYFGYGSLVNCDTRTPGSIVARGTLSGWVREWRIAGPTPRGGVCSLTVRPEAGTDIRGLMVREHSSGLAALDEREGRYDRVDLDEGSFCADPDAPAHDGRGFVYRARSEHYRWGDADHPILLSYVDCVLAGFYRHWGEAGVRHFIETTHGWHVPILDDREAPRYPRAVALGEDLLGLIDAALADADVRWLVAA